MPDAVARPRLTDTLGRADVTVVVGPAGYGKTTLLADWARRTPATAWLTVSAADADPVRLLMDVTAALRVGSQPMLATPGMAVRTPFDLLEPPAPGAGLDAYVATLHDRLAASGRPAALVLDDVHTLFGAKRSVELLDQLVHGMPARVRVVMASRQIPPIRLSRLRLSRRLAVIDADALAFTAGETAAVIGRVLAPERTRAQAVFRATGGWPVATRLLAMAPAAERAGDGHSWHDDSMTDYLVSEVLGEIDPELRALILDASIDDAVCADLLDTVRGRDDSAELLERCFRAGLFLTVQQPPDALFAWYTWHQVFVSHVRRIADREGLSRVRDLHALAARWWASVDAVKSVAHALRGGRPELGAELAAETWPELVLAGLASTVVEIVQQMPPGLRFEAEMQLAAAFAEAVRGDDARARHRLVAARASADRLDPDDRVRFDARAAALSLRYLATDLQSLQDSVDIGRRQLSRIEAGPWVPDPVTLMLTRLCVGMGEARLQHDNPTALRLLRSAAEMADELGMTAVRLTAIAETCIPMISTGELESAAACADDVLDSARAKGWGVPRALAPALAFTGWFAFWRGELERSGDLLREVVALLDRPDTPLRGLTAYYRAQAHVYCGAYDQAGELLDEMTGLASSGLVPPYWESILAALDAEILLGTGQTGRARRRAQRPAPGGQYRLATTSRARVLLRVGDVEQALALLEGVPVTERFMNVEVLVQRLRAEALHRLDRPEEARRALGEAISGSQRYGLVLPFLVDGAFLRPFLVAFGESSDRSAEVAPILALLDGTATGTPAVAGGSGLTPRELSVLRQLGTSMTLAEIAGSRSVSVNTIKSQVASVYRKLEASNRRDAVRTAIDRGLL